MEIVVEGWRAAANDWDAVSSIPGNRLPGLTEEQRSVAQKLGIPEADYARSVLAGERTSGRLLEKTERLARLLQQKLTGNGHAFAIRRVSLLTWEHRFEVQVESEGHDSTFRIAEDVVDDLFESGSADADRRLSRILDMALYSRVA